MTTLMDLKACEEAVRWAAKYDSFEAAWAECERGDWMLWLAAKAPLCSRQDLVLAACACARLSLKYVKAGEKRPRVAIETAEAWARGDATLDRVRVAAYASSYASSYASAASSAAYAAAYAAYAAAHASSASSAAARTSTLKQCADIVRAIVIPGRTR